MLGSAQAIRSRTARPGMPMPFSFYLLSVYLATCIIPCLAQSSKLFQWQFASNVSLPLHSLLTFILTTASSAPQSLSTSLPTCQSLPIIVKSYDPTTNSTHGTPPYYMISFAIGGTPITSLIGTDENNLAWTITHPVGASTLTCYPVYQLTRQQDLD
jgi:hypothetical protein